MKDEVYILVDPKTGGFWQKKSYNGRRGVYAFKSQKKAESTLRQFRPKPEEGEVEIRKFILYET